MFCFVLFFALVVVVVPTKIGGVDNQAQSGKVEGSLMESSISKLKLETN